MQPRMHHAPPPFCAMFVSKYLSSMALLISSCLRRHLGKLYVILRFFALPPFRGTQTSPARAR
ncbi:hypothetical protein BD311DRAFT_366957 [Dichomitus squalens]|uniref:Uncharacterized protein n=1 Tax=Dichomitus squalens TaxID=114155 RepID=A0A4Q9MJT2_9APHY|nr:hypothetical protein BD311DRAFT_366957 [Dichomitus squalens]